MAKTRIAQLNQIINENVSLVDKHLQDNEYLEPSFDIHAPKNLPTSGEAELSRTRAIRAAEELVDLLKGPAELLRPDWTEHSSLRVISSFDIASIVPIESSVSFGAIAAKIGLPERDVTRVLRHAMTRHIFVEPHEGFVAHTALSRLLAEDEEQRAVTSTVLDVMMPSMIHITDALKQWPGSEEPGHSGFGVIHKKPMYQAFSEQEEMGRRFGVFVAHSASHRSSLEVDGLQWKGKVVDVGGGHGYAMIDVLKRHPEVSAVVQELPEVVDAGKEILPSELDGRLRFEAHDFFQPQTESADIFFFRWILHNHSDKYCLKILRNLVSVMTRSTKIVINDYLLPEPLTAEAAQERTFRNADMTVMGVLNAPERDIRAWRQLFHDADSRFNIESVTVTPPGLMAVIVLGWQQ